jgi:hypothetical protein
MVYLSYHYLGGMGLGEFSLVFWEGIALHVQGNEYDTGQGNGNGNSEGAKNGRLPLAIFGIWVGYDLVMV